MAEKRKRKQLSLQEKIQILKAIDSGKKIIDVSKEFNMPRTTVSTILKDREKIISLAEKSQLCPERKRLRLGNFQQIDAAVATWFKDVRSKNIPVSGPMIQEKARELATILGIDNFEASNGWLFRFRDRNGITWRQISGESADANKELADTWKEKKLREILTTYDAEDIFNADETAFFYQLLPHRTMAFKGETCSGGKKSKQRISVLFCCNMNGTKKIKPLVIGKSAKPRCFKNIARLPCDYKHNANAWMTRPIFTEWLLKLNEVMVKEKRNIILLIDNCSAHMVEVRLTNVRLEFLPPNCTSILQPLDQGIIRSVKVHFRKRLLNRLLINLRLQITDAINVRQAIEMINSAWCNTQQTIIQNCWRKAGFVREENIEVSENGGATAAILAVPSSHHDESESELWNEVVSTYSISSEITFDDYVNCDSHTYTSAELTNHELLNVERTPTNSDSEDDTNDPEEEDISSGEAYHCVEKLRRYFACHKTAPDVFNSHLTDFEHFVTHNILKSKQTKITDFLKS